MRFFILFCLTGFFTPIFGQVTHNSENENNFVEKRYLVILGSDQDFHKLYDQAKTISASSKRAFSMQGKVYDEKRGLILPDNDSDISYAGTYLMRRENLDYKTHQEYISIEKSEAYPSFGRNYRFTEKGYYLIVAGIYEDQASATQSLKHYRTIVPKAYLKKTEIYMGCMH